MSDLYYSVQKTPMFPAEWYGGPFWNKDRLSNETSYFFRTKEEAEKNAKSLALRNNAPFLELKD